MSEEPYKGVRLVLGDPDPAFGKTVSSGLFPLGLRDISVCLDGEKARQAAAATVDVIVSDIKLPGLDFRAFAQDIRHGRLGQNPFVILIATLRDAGEAKEAGIAECGMDELMFKPIHPLMLVRKIGMLAKERKPFVMTPGYVGPTRRAERRNDGSDDNLVAVPNTLRAKVVEKQSDKAISGLVAAGVTSLGKGKAVSGLKVITRLTQRLGTLQQGNAPAEDGRRVLNALTRMANQVAAQHKESGNHVPPIAERIARLSGRAEAAPAPSKVEIELLTKLSDAAMVAFSADPKVAVAVPEIVATVDSYLARA